MVDVREINTETDVELLHWRLLASHKVTGVEDAWRIVQWYKQRWIIEQFFRVLKTQGLKLEDSQVATADRLLKLVAIAAKAAVITMQLLQARVGGQQLYHVAFNDGEIGALAALNKQLEAKSKRLKNPHPPDSLAWAAWIIGRPGAGMATHRPSRRARSPSKTASNTSRPSQRDGDSEMRACPRAFAGTTASNYFPGHDGLRFSLNAFSPSLASSVIASSAIWLSV
ncbi:transposase [Bradyrhizobium guangzhouense]|uniref:transposase n=1 Tax=Bradyrhizobium guangzhouense TaxID=1325095 RepID=UPI003221B6F1